MWYLIGLVACLAYFIIIPFVRYRNSWNNNLKTADLPQDLWFLIFGHFLVSLIPFPLDYDNYQQAVWDWDDFAPFGGWLLILLGITLLWFIAIPLIVIIVTGLLIKFCIEDYFEQKTKTNKEVNGFKD